MLMCSSLCVTFVHFRHIVPYLKKFGRNPVTGEVSTCLGIKVHAIAGVF